MSERMPNNFNSHGPESIEGIDSFMHDVFTGYGDETPFDAHPKQDVEAPNEGCIEGTITSTLGSYEEPKLQSGDVFRLGNDTYKLEMVDWAGGGLIAKNVEDNSGAVMSFYEFAQKLQRDAEER